MNKKKVIILSFIIIAIAVFFTVVYNINKPFLKDLDITGITFDGENVIFIKKIEVPDLREFDTNIENPLRYICEVYKKNILNKKVSLIKHLNFDCRPTYGTFTISKNEKYLFFYTTEDPLEERKGSDIAIYENSIYAYDVQKDNFLLIKEGKRITSDEGRLMVDYSLPIPSPINDNQLIFTKTTTKTQSLELGENFSLTKETFFMDINTKKEVLIYNETLTGEPSAWPEMRYRETLTRWSPDGKAIIYEIGAGIFFRDKRNDTMHYNNEQYIIYLDNLEIKTFLPGNVRGDINACGYYYNENLNHYFRLEKGNGETIFFPDGKTYLKTEICGGEFCSWDVKYYLKKSNEEYCKPVNNE